MNRIKADTAGLDKYTFQVKMPTHFTILRLHPLSLLNEVQSFSVVFIGAKLPKTVSLSTLFLVYIALAAVSFAGETVLSGNDFVPVPAGCFQMGNGFSDAYHLEKPVHEVCLDGFRIAKHDVTVGDFSRFVRESAYVTESEKNGGCYVHDGLSWRMNQAAGWRSPGFRQDDRHPVVCVTWNDAVQYAAWLSAKDTQSYRLPTEAEWEYAARGGGRNERYAGGDDVDALAWYAANADGTTHPVGLKKPNALGLYDMSGNVWQWTADWYSQGYYRQSQRSNPKGPEEGRKRVFRGGSWFYDARGVRASYRDFATPDFRSSYLGFRLVQGHDDKGAK